MINRALEKEIQRILKDRKAIIIFGARQTGKTTLLKKFFINEKNILWLNGDNRDTHELLNDNSASRYKILFSK